MHSLWEGYEDYEDDWTDFTTNGPDGEIGDTGTLFSYTDEYSGWPSAVANHVSSQDPIDYMKFTLKEAGPVCFTISATDAVRFTIYSLVQDKKGNYSLKTLQTVTPEQSRITQYWDEVNQEWKDGAEPEWQYSALTDPLTLGAGSYYFSVESLNAGNAANIENGENGDTPDVIENTNYELEYAFSPVPLLLSYANIDEGTLKWEEPARYQTLVVETPVKVCFTVYATDNTTTFLVSDVAQDKKGNYSLNPLLSAKTTAANDSDNGYAYKGTTDTVMLGPGQYYVSMESANAAKGIGTDYLIALNENESVFYDFHEITDGFSASGFFDPETNVNYGCFSLDDAAKLSFSINADDMANFSLFTLIQNTDGSWTMKSLQSGSLKKSKEKKYKLDGEWYTEEPESAYSLTTGAFLLGPGQYFYSVEGKGNAESSYSLSLSEDSVFYESVGTIDDTFSLDGAISEDEPVNYGKLTLESAAKLKFFFGADDAPVKFTLYKLATNKKGLSFLSPVQSGTLKKSKVIRYKEDGEWYTEDPDYRYSMTTGSVLLNAGEYYFSVEAKKKGAETSYYGTLTEDSVFFTQGNNLDDDWKLLDDNEIESVGADLSLDDWVGYGDAIDYRKLTLESAAKLSFTVNATSSVKFFVYSVDKKGNLNKLLSVSTAKTKVIKYKEDGDWWYEYPDWDYSSTSGSILLDLNAVGEDGRYGEYYIAIQSKNAAKGGSADYQVTVNESLIFDQGDLRDDDWNLLEENGIESVDITRGFSDWVGFGDVIDFRQFTIGNAAKLSFIVNASDSVKFTVYNVDQNGNLNQLLTMTTAKTKVVKYKEDGEWYYEYPDWDYSSTSSPILLPLNTRDENGQQFGEYYFSVQSTNADKGGFADYEIAIDNDTSVFFNKGANDDDTWAGAGDLGQLSWSKTTKGWVGFDDSIDCVRFSLENDSTLSFSVDADDAVKFTIYKLDGTDDNIVATSLQTTTPKKNKTTKYYEDGEWWYDEPLWGYSGETKSLSLKAGNYGFTMESTNADKGGYADYEVSVSEFYATSSILDSLASDLETTALSAVSAADASQDSGLTGWQNLANLA